MCFGFTKILAVFAAITVVLYLYSRNKEPIFSHEIIAEITKEVVGKQKGMVWYESKYFRLNF